MADDQQQSFYRTFARSGSGRGTEAWLHFQPMVHQTDRRCFIFSDNICARNSTADHKWQPATWALLLLMLHAFLPSDSRRTGLTPSFRLTKKCGRTTAEGSARRGDGCTTAGLHQPSYDVIPFDVVTRLLVSEIDELPSAVHAVCHLQNPS